LLSVKSAAFAPVIVTAGETMPPDAVPLSESVSVRGLERLPSAVEGKVNVGVSEAFATPCAPVPLSAAVCVTVAPVPPVPEIVSVALSAPTIEGVNVTLIVQDDPAATEVQLFV
jgi:hypothetical protein